jgi:hypothetical protein
MAISSYQKTPPRKPYCIYNLLFNCHMKLTPIRIIHLSERHGSHGSFLFEGVKK